MLAIYDWQFTTSDRGIAKNATTVDRDRDGRDDRPKERKAGAGIGGVAGGIIGLLTGLGKTRTRMPKAFGVVERLLVRASQMVIGRDTKRFSIVLP